MEPAIQSDGLQGAEHVCELVRTHNEKVFDRHIRIIEKRNEKLAKEGKPLEKLEKRSDDGFIIHFLGPIVNTLPEDKPPQRTVFSFAGMQSSKGVTHLRETGQVYNNVYPDVSRTAGLVFPL